MEYMEVPVFPGEGTCSDNACPCGFPGAAIPRGTGYMYVSPEVVEFRRDAPTMLQAERKINRMQATTGRIVVGGAGVFAPILMCEMGATKRGLDLAIANEDAQHWWEHGEVPLRATPLLAERTATKPPPSTPASAPETEAQSTAAPADDETTARIHDGAFGVALTPEHRAGVDRLVAHAAERAGALRKRARLRWWMVAAVAALAVGLPILFAVVNVGGGALRFGLAGALLIAAIGGGIWVNRVNSHSSAGIGSELDARIETEGLPRWPIVDAMADRLESSRTDKAVLHAIDEDAAHVLELRDRGLTAIDELVTAGVVPVSVQLQFNSSNGQLQSASVDGESHATAFRALAADYLAAGAPCEALAAMAVAATTYGRIAPPGRRDQLALRAEVGEMMQGLDLPGQTGIDLGVGGSVEVTGGAVKQGAKSEIVRNTYDIFHGFSYDAEARSILAAIDKRRELSVVESLALLAKGGGDDTIMAHVGEVLEEARSVTKDPTFVAACVDHLTNLSPPAIRIMGLNNMRWIPDRAVLPSVFELCGLVPFYPGGIDVIARFGGEAGPEVAQRFEHAANENARFNLALALGILGYQQARPLIDRVLADTASPTERLGCHYALARWGDETQVAPLVSGLDHAEADVRHAAAITLEHLATRIPDEAYIRHLDDSNPLVRLRLLRKLKAQNTGNPKLAEIVVGLLGDANDEVRSAAIEAAGSLPFELVGDLVLDAAGPTHEVELRAAAIETLGHFADVDVAGTLVPYATRPKHPEKVRRAAVDALGERAAAEAIQPLTEMMAGTFSEVARVALIRIGVVHPDAVLAALPKGHDVEVDGIRAMLGDGPARERIAKKLGRWRSMDPATLAPVLMTARMVGDPESETSLRGMLEYRKNTNFPGDRLVAHWAFGALIQSLARKVVQAKI